MNTLLVCLLASNVCLLPGLGEAKSPQPPASGLYCMKQYWYCLAPYGADIDDR